LKIYLVYDDARPAWNIICGAFKEKEAALKCAQDHAGSKDTYIEDEERWESPYHTSVWVGEIEVK
jgi:hypothetical protein